MEGDLDAAWQDMNHKYVVVRNMQGWIPGKKYSGDHLV
jgi:hypothetical protein